MNRSVILLNRTMLLASVPFIGIMLWLLSSNIVIQLSESAMPIAKTEQASPEGSLAKEASSGLDLAHDTATHTQQSIQKQLELYTKTNAEMKEISTIAASQAMRPLEIYDRNITNLLGKPSATIDTKKLRAQLFNIKENDFKAYAVKIKLKSADAMKMVMGGDELGKSQTTLEAVKQYGAAVGVNAGGFADSGGKRYPLSTTIFDGSYIKSFEASYSDLFFVGMNDKNELIGGKFTNQQQLDAKKPKFGASFVPVLLKSGVPQEIPVKWQTSPKRAPRTVIANYKDDQLLIIVTDGYNKAGSAGATLSEMQTLLRRYGAVDGYNLDGGGSSSLIFNGKVINHPSDGQLRKLPTHFLFFK